MKQKKILLLLVLCGLTATLLLFSQNFRPVRSLQVKPCCDSGPKATALQNDTLHQGCVFKTVFEGEYSDSDFMHKTPEGVDSSIRQALAWMIKEQLPDGGWSGGFHTSQQVFRDPNAKSDPGTTAMVSMAILRCGSTPFNGPYSNALSQATEFLLKAVETSPAGQANITTITGTQPQIKLGQNIDVMLTSQFLTNLLPSYDSASPASSRIRNCIQNCVNRIQSAQNGNGSFRGAGWAGVLQSSFANNALESAWAYGIKVDTAVLNRSSEYQKQNFGTGKGDVSVKDGAGIVLYSVSSTGRASAKQAMVAKKAISKAKKEGKVSADAPVSKDNLVKSGMSENEALKYTTAYEINNASVQMAQQDRVMAGFGNNGGEEFVSFLQTGEGLIIGHDKSWKNWYDNVSGKLLKIQEKDGYWRGHHCITSPVFCTATCLLILSIQNDIKPLLALGNQ